MGSDRSRGTVGGTVRIRSSKHDGVVMSPADAVVEIIDVIRRGGLAVVPFDVSYAFLGSSRDAIDRIYELKLRPGSKPCPMLASWQHFLATTSAAPERIAAIKAVADAGLPVGIITSTNWQSDLVRSIPDDVTERVARDGRLALFINMGGLADLLLAEAERVGLRLFGSSANLSGTGNSFRLDEIPADMLAGVDITCEGETCRYVNNERMASSIIDVDATAFTRRGILAEEIERLMDAGKTATNGASDEC